MAVAAWAGRCSGGKARKLPRVRCRQKGRALAPGIDQEVQQRDEQMAVGLLHGRTSQRDGIHGCERDEMPPSRFQLP
jgi:hypothetical protein